MTKKKYRFGLSVLLVLLFIILLGMFSSCYARTTLTDDEAKYVFQYLIGSEYNSQLFNSGYYNFTGYFNSSYLSKSNLDSSFNNFKNYFNANNTIDIDPNSTVFWFRLDPGYEYRIYVANCNNGKVDNLPFLNLKFADYNSNFKSLQINAIDDNKQPVNFGFSCFIGNVSNGVLNFNSKSDFNIGPSYSSSSNNSNFYVGNNVWNSNYTYPVTDCLPGLVTFKSTNSVYMNWDGTNYFNEPKAFLIKSLYIDDTPEPEPEPENPSNNSGLGDITNSSGDSGGNINLQPIEQGLTDIQNQISGDNQKLINTLTEVPDLSGETISAEQITENINFGLITNNSTLNGYTNFWFTLTNGLRGALTGNVRSIDINFRGQTYTINLDDFSIQLPQQLKFILGMVSTIYFVILIVKWWKIIIDKITGGDIDEVLAMNEEERNYRFVLGGVYIA